MYTILRGTTIVDYLGPAYLEAPRDCIARAALCSRLAKLVTGPLRAKLYHIKDQNIRAVLNSNRNAVEITSDHDHYFGLLSVRLLGKTTIRVHTHENWLEASWTI